MRNVQSSLPKTPLVALYPSASVFEAAKEMTAAGCGSCIVIDDQTLVGIVTERDILYRVVALGKNTKTTPLNDVMTRNPLCVKPETFVEHALFLMKENGFRHVPVVSADGTPIGVFSIRDALPEEISHADRLLSESEHIYENMR